MKSAQKSRQKSPADENDSDLDVEMESPKPTASVSRTRSRRSTARGRTQRGADNEEQERSASPEYHDGLDDLVAMQLQQGLQNQPEVQEFAEVVEEEPLPEYVEKMQNLCKDGYHDEIRALSTAVLEKLSGKRQIPLQGLEAEYNKANHLIEQTVTVGEGNSMLLLGSRGCGKTAMIETIISSLAKEHSKDFHVVRLNGFFHTDDRLAVREMWRQLGRETNTEDDTAKVSSHADTMATLLALLSHPDELFGAAGNGNAVTAAKSIVILLDEFDLFVTHPRQTLLYNLFDIAQARKAPIAVIGLTTKVDVTEMLEKRVKSRFSHRYVYVPLPRTYDIFSDICKASLDLDEDEVQQITDLLSSQNTVLDSNRWQTLLGGWKEYLKVWTRFAANNPLYSIARTNSDSQELWEDKDFQFHLKRIYNQTKSVKEFLTSALLPITNLHLSTHGVDEPSIQIPAPKHFSSQSLSCPDPAPLPFSTSVSASSSSSSLPLALLVAATRLAALFDPGNEGMQAQSLSPLALSFPAAYAEYVRLLTSAKTSASVSGAAATAGRVWGRDVSREAWEKLVTWGLVTPVGSGNGTADGQMFRVEISYEEVIDMAGSGGSLGQWWRDG
jgi:origin recognition complex subunit 4